MRKILPALLLLVLYALAPLHGACSSAQLDQGAKTLNPTQEDVRGEILTRWTEMGAESGPLGSPVGDVQESIGGGLQGTFRHGIIRWSPESGLDVEVLEGVTFTENQLIVSEGAVLTMTSENTFQIVIQKDTPRVPIRPKVPPKTGTFRCGCSRGRCSSTADGATLTCAGDCGCKLVVTFN